MAEPQITSLIADTHDPSSGDCCTGDELMLGLMENGLARLYLKLLVAWEISW